MYEGDSVGSRHNFSTRLKHSHVITAINDLLEPHPFGYQCNVLESIMQHNSLFEHFKFPGKYSSKLCKFKINYRDKSWKNYTEPLDWFMIKKIKYNVELGIFQHQKQLNLQNQQNPQKSFTTRTWMIKEMKLMMQQFLLFISVSDIIIPEDLLC